MNKTVDITKRNWRKHWGKLLYQTCTW